jgi:beta-aspartyl-dipeptidase (metallo-type)
MLTLIRNADVYAPEPLGRQEVLVIGSRIAAVAESIDLRGEPLEVVDGEGLWLLPGFVDPLTHPAGGGGEGGFGNRTPELEADDFIRAGVTTPICALGTDSIARTLDVLYGNVMGLRANGLDARMLSGSYRVPAVTLTGDVARDLVLIDPVIGVGEIAIADHRGSQPSAEELRRLAADVQLGGILSGKRGTVLVHVGEGESGLKVLEAALEGSDLARWLFYPTHCNRHAALLEQAIGFARAGSYVDFTVSTTDEFIEAGEVPALAALARAIEAGAPPDRLTFSSDAGGSLPLFRDGVLVGLQAAGPHSLLELLIAAINERPLPIESVISALTRNPAQAFGLETKGRITAGADADLLLLDPRSGQLQDVFCLGHRLQAVCSGD